MPDCKPNRDLNVDSEITVKALNTLKTATTHRILAAEVCCDYMIYYADACYAVRACQAHLEILRHRQRVAKMDHFLSRRDLIACPSFLRIVMRLWIMITGRPMGKTRVWVRGRIRFHDPLAFYSLNKIALSL